MGFRTALVAFPIAALVFCLAAAAHAQAPAAPASAPATAQATDTTPEDATEAHVLLANRPVATLRVPFFGVSPARRAERAEAALREVQQSGGPGIVTVQIEPQGHALLVDGALVVVLTAGDADRLRGQSLKQASREAADRLRQAWAEVQEAHNPRELLRATGVSVLATLLAALLVMLVRRLRRRGADWMTRRITRNAEGLHVAGAQLLPADRVAAALVLGLSVLVWLVLAVVAFEWLSFVLAQFPYTRPWGEGLTAFLVTLGRQLAGGTVRALPDLMVAVAIFVLARGVVLLFRPFFLRVAASGRRGGGWLDADTALPTQRLFNVGVAIFAMVMAYPYLPGSSSEAFKGISVLIGLMVTIGGSSLFGQAASGLVLMYSRTLRVGDYVRVGDHEGTVTAMGVFTTLLRTGLGAELTLPNALVLGAVTKNYSRGVVGNGFVVDITVTIGYDTPWRQVEAMLVEAARQTPRVMESPPPKVFQTALSDFYPEYRLVCQANAAEAHSRAQVVSTLHANIQDVFNRYGVQLMSPHYLGDPATSKVVPPEGWYAQPAQPPGATRQTTLPTSSATSSAPLPSSATPTGRP